MSILKRTLTLMLILIVSCANTYGGTGSGVSNSFTIDNRENNLTLNGTVTEIDSQGLTLGVLQGATISIAGQTTISDSVGRFSLSDLPVGTYTLTAEKSGYYISSKEITLNEGMTFFEIIKLQLKSGEPTAYDIKSPDGKHIIEGVPGDLSFAAMIDWNGSSGQVYVNANGIRHQATVVDLGNGIAQAMISINAPTSISTCNEMTIEVINGEGLSTEINAGVYFYPMPRIIPAWYKNNIPWVVNSNTLSFSYNKDWTPWKAQIPSGVYESKAELSLNGAIKYDLFTGTFNGSMGGNGTYSHTIGIANIENFGEGTLSFKGDLDIGLAGCNSRTIKPSWEVALGGKSGLRGPVVTIVPVIFPPSAPAINGLLKVWGVKDVMKALKLELALFGNLALAGNYDNGWGDGFLGTTSLDISGTLGIEGKAYLEISKAKAGVYAGGSATPKFQVQPEWAFQEAVFRAWVGIFAKALGFEFKDEFAAEYTWSPASGTMSLMRSSSLSQDAVEGKAPAWQPIGSELPKWGKTNILYHTASNLKALNSFASAQSEPGFEEELLVENVTQLASPSIVSNATGSTVLFSLFDTNKPWHSAFDISSINKDGANPWTLSLVTDDLASEFTPEILSVDAETELAAWEIVIGDTSEAQEPGEVTPHLEIATSWYDHNTGTWTMPAYLTANAEVDHSPQPVKYGATQAVIWIHNADNEMPGNLTNGDSIMMSEWTGSSWSMPQTLWTQAKGVLGYSFVEDADSESHLIFTVDEDGDNETKDDCELYLLSTSSGIWQAAVRLTNDGVEDSIPVLVSSGGSPMCVWNSDGDLQYSLLSSWSPKILFTEFTVSNKAASLAGQSMPGGAAVAYTAKTNDGVDIVAAFYDSALDTWSLPRQLTFDDHVETSLSLNYEGSDLAIAYLKTQTERNNVDIELEGEIYHLENIPQPARTDIYVLNHPIGNDIAVMDDPNLVVPSNPALGSSAALTALIENRGDLPVENVQVAFYVGDPQSDGVQIGTTQVLSGMLPAGAKNSITVDWNLTYEPGSRDIYIVVDPDLSIEDRDRSNNTLSKTVSLPDLVIENSWAEEIGPDRVALIAKVVNTGVLPVGDFDISWRLGSEIGEEIGISSIPSLKVNNTYEAIYNWTITNYVYRDQPVMVYAVVNPSEDVVEFDKMNNSHGSIVTNSQACFTSDINSNGVIDIFDLQIMINQWLDVPEYPSADIAPYPRDGQVDIIDFAKLSQYWLEGVE
ncbi:MAG: carboxypeptidase regulatory-like domain-containing protein [Phycisphaerae bacterium]|nr:carboxypeptidase regulatory-like domain-containing protein [Phycisphaerae bacterium]